MLITKKHLDLYKPDPSILIVEALNNLKNIFSTKDLNAVTVFLSHKHDEEEILKKVVALFRKIGIKVYLDWQDDQMPKETSGETAQRLKSNILDNKKFIFLATNAAIESKWCNWELGFGDANKYPKDIALMPIAENDGTWKGNEYLQIYPSIKTDYEIFTGDYYVEFKNGKVKFVDWLKT